MTFLATFFPFALGRFLEEPLDAKALDVHTGHGGVPRSRHGRFVGDLCNKVGKITAV